MFPTAEDHNDDLDDHEKSTHSTPPVTTNISTVPGQEKYKLPPQVVQVSKKRLSHQPTDEILEDQYTADRQRLITVSERKLQNKLQQLQIKKTKEMAALVQEEIQKAMLPMIDDACPGSSLHNDDATLTKRTIGTQSPCHSNLDEAVLNSSQSAQLVHETSTHVDVTQQLTAGTPASPTFMNETLEIGTHESEPGTNFVNIEGVEADNFHPASPMLAQITQYEPSSSKELTTTDQIVEAEPAACKDPLVESICTFQNLKSDATACSATTALERQETFVANVVPSSNNSASTHPPELVSEVIVPTTAIVIPNIAADQVQSHSVQTERSNMPSEDSSIMKFVGTDGQADSAFLLPVTSAHNVLGHGNQGDQPESNAFAVQHPQQDSSKDVLHEVGNTVTMAPTADGIQEIAFIDPKTTKSSSQIDVSDAQKATKNHSFPHNPASDVVQLQHTDKTTLEDGIQKQSNDHLENLDVSKIDILSTKDIEIADTDSTSKDVPNISSPPLSIQIVGDVSIMSVSQMTREYDRMNVPAGATIHTTQHNVASTLQEVSRIEDNQPIVLETSVLPDHSSSSLDVLQIDPSKLPDDMPKPSTVPSDITLQIGQTSPKESSTLQDSDKKILDKCVEMILCMTPNLAPANDNNESLSLAINEVLSENLEQTLALAEIQTQCTAGDIESSSCQSTQEDVANVAQMDITAKKQDESQEHPSDNSSARVSSERTKDDDISKVGKQDSDSHTSYLTPNGECFDCAGSINPSMKMRKQRYQKKEEIVEGISELIKKKQYLVKKLNDMYNTLVACSKFRGLRKTRRRNDNDTGGTKIRIGPASVTERELV
ncbi:uncharacterized protein LOC119267794 isoform X2 [Triticum dicoccoides]|uniref:uncharacterized protein LOC119267794 isoform X2 n=1 Tax=Triticum dicoccoides TaxID=85692 RepID=UPI00188F0E91|nr:uncharacterized protein LOC119267794 isoform X2 [Triticum dicoccoides]XP_044339710.1 uncharacterized protein LOC123060905 isoform X2 [Triticum aestivum]